MGLGRQHLVSRTHRERGLQIVEFAFTLGEVLPKLFDLLAMLVGLVLQCPALPVTSVGVPVGVFELGAERLRLLEQEGRHVVAKEALVLLKLCLVVDKPSLLAEDSVL